MRLKTPEEKIRKIVKSVVIAGFLFILFSVHLYKGLIGELRRKSKLLTNVCNNYIQKHFSEEQISFGIALFIILILFLCQQPLRFSRYIEQTYENIIKKEISIKESNKNKSSCLCCCKCFCNLSKSGFSCIRKFFQKRLLTISPFASTNVN